MLCYADMIVRIKYIKQHVKEDSDSLVVWALGAYPVEREDYNIELVLFVPVDLNSRDPETQAVFEIIFILLEVKLCQNIIVAIKEQRYLLYAILLYYA